MAIRTKITHGGGFSPKRSRLFAAASAAVIAIACLLAVPAFAATEGATGHEADDSTRSQYENAVSTADTKDVGRVWTDKTVHTGDVTGTQAGDVSIGDSDFLVELSAMSSVASVLGKSEVPLDIVLVLDRSGSMDNELGMGPVYPSAGDRGTYYIEDGNDYREIRYYRQEGSWGYYTGFINREFHPVTLKTSAADTTPGSVQAYGEIDRMTALKTAVNGFIDQAVTANANTDVSLQHRVAIVSYASEATVDESLTLVNDQTADTLKATVDDLYANGSTAADYAMEQAQAVLSPENVRPNAKKVVIFFTDGEPNHKNGFDGDVANDAIAGAKVLKDSGAMVFSIGVFESADASEVTDQTSEFNRYMHAMSSNYPDATGYEIADMGARAADSEYYYTAADSESLEGVFDAIADKVLASVSSPTHVDQGKDPSNSGYVVFTDQLGDYMHVDGFKHVLFANARFSDPVKSTSGMIDTYTFSGVVEGDAVYPDADLSNLVITVQRSADAKTGDLVTVKIPAAFLPVVEYKVEIAQDGTVTTTLGHNETNSLPIRVFYGVSLKPGVIEDMKSPDDDLLAYMQANMTADGTVAFYEGKYDATSGAGATSKFVPSATNNFYYFQADKILYTDPECTVPATSIELSGTYYYERDYYAVGQTAPQKQVTRIPGDSNLLVQGFAEVDDQGRYYIPVGTPRVTSLGQDFTVEKTNNVTSTSEYVIAPSWTDVGFETPVDGRAALNALGNNGRLFVEAPAGLTVSKTVQAATGLTLPSGAEQLDWEFDITVTKADGTPLSGIYSAIDSADVRSTVVFVGGKASVTVKHGQFIGIMGLPAGASFRVEEPAGQHPGFAQTAPEAQAQQGVLEHGVSSTVAFTNTYSAAPAQLSGAESLKVKKVYNEWTDVPSTFTATLVADASAPMPADAQLDAESGMLRSSVTFTSAANAEQAFGDIEYTAPGTYGYGIIEQRPGADEWDKGISYSLAAYRVEVTVVDDGSGNLVASSKMIQVNDDSGKVTGSTDPVDAAVFNNTFRAESTSWNFVGSKAYTDNSGINPLTEGKFQFKLTPVAIDGVEVSADSPEFATIPRIGATDPVDGSYTTGNESTGLFSFGQTTFVADNVGHTFTYEMREVLPAGATAENGYTVDGMTYDPAVWTIELTIAHAQMPNGATGITVTRALYKDGVLLDTSVAAPVFANSYNPAPVTLAGDAAIHGAKTLAGRDWNDADAFGFTLTAVTPGAPMPAQGGEHAQATAADASFAFGDMTFTKPGTYEYTVTEDAPSADADGLVYDRHSAAVTVTVADQGGVLVATVAYSNEGAPQQADADDTSKAAFTNTYSASASVDGGVSVSKTLTGRTMRTGEFSFTITGQDGVGTTAQEADAKLAATDRSFANVQSRASGQPDVMTKMGTVSFDQSDAGKTYSFLIDEVEPATGLAGVTYDKSQYVLELAVADNADGTMSVTRSIWKVADAEGNAVAREAADAISFQNTYAAAPVSGTFALAKILDGRDWHENETFSFTLNALNGAPLPVNEQGETVTEAVVSGYDAAGGTDGKAVPFGFGTVTFNAVGTYSYTVTENAPAANGSGLSYDRHTAKVTFTVTDAGRGQLAVTSSVSGALFTNRYSVEPFDLKEVLSLTVRKELVGHDMQARQFEFTVTPADQYSAGKIGFETADPITFYNFAGVMNDQGVSVSDMPSTSPLIFDASDIGKTVRYVFAETPGNEPGYTYSDKQYALEATVADDGDGTLSVHVKVTELTTGTVLGEQVFDENSEHRSIYATFRNTYTASTPEGAAADISAMKVMDGRALEADEFSFQLTTRPANGEGTVLQTVTNPAGAIGEAVQVDFQPISYTVDGLIAAIADGYASRAVVDGKAVYTVNYTVSEVSADLPAGVTSAKRSMNVSVKVTDNGDGTLSTSVVYPDGASSLDFANVYSTGDPIEVTFSGSKNLAAADGLAAPDIEGAYQFTIASETPGAPLPANTTVTNGGIGDVTFAPVTFTLDMLADVAPDAANQRSKTFVYTVTESGQVAGVTNDPQPVKTFSVTLHDDADGNLALMWVDSSDLPQGDYFTFTNTYTVAPSSSSVTDSITVEKVLEGRDLAEGEFTFQLLEGEDVVAQGTNAADGTVALSAITYTEPGEHTYSLVEVAGSAGGVTYDRTVFTVKTIVTDNSDGTLSATHEFVAEPAAGDAAGDDHPVFRNTYTAASTDVVLQGAKVLQGRELAADEFSFELTDEQGSVLQTVRNAADGSVTFGALEFDAPGVYTYQVREVLPADDDAKTAGIQKDGVTYDETVRTVTVTVTDDGQGSLGAVVETADGALTFTNVYVEPVVPGPEDPGSKPDPKPALPQTGDPLTATMIVLSLAAVVAACVFALARRKA